MAVTAAQRAQLLRAINPSRVGTDGKKFSHVEGYEIRAHLNRLFDFTGWSAETLKMELIFESENAQGKWTVAYRAQLRLIVDIAVYTEWATGDCNNFPSRADAHDMALKTAETQALKRAAANLGDQFGLSLYAKGSKEALVKGVIGFEQKPAAEGVDSHITKPQPPERQVEAAATPEPRTTSAAPVKAAVSETMADLRARTAAIEAKTVTRGR